MKQIKNTSLQSWNIYLQTEEGVKSFYMTPEQTITVPASYITDDVLKYQQRNLISIKNV